MNSIAQRYSHASQNDIVKEINSVHESLSSSSNIPQLELAPSIAIRQFLNQQIFKSSY